MNYKDYQSFRVKHGSIDVFVIEYDGKQHFKPVDIFGGQDGFEETQLHDQIKTQYCKDNNIELIRIPYWEKDNIEEILNHKLITR